jgi:diadenylate cyclase
LHRALTYLLGPGTSLADVLLAVVDVAVVTFLCYRVLRLLRGTKAVAVLVGLCLVAFGYLGAQWAGLETLSWLLGHCLSYSFIFGIVLFQEDIRRALAELGRGSRLLAVLAPGDRAVQLGTIDAVVRASVDLARRRLGALIVLERAADLSDVAESGLRLDAAITPELLVAIFQPQGPLHDGAVVVRGARLAATGCLLPLSAAAAPQELGTRHRAALGLVEEVDAAVVVVSEERGEISVALEGVLHRGLDEGALRALLRSVFVRPGRPGAGTAGGRNAEAGAAPGPTRPEEPHAAV